MAQVISCMSWGLLGSAQRSWVQRKYRCAPIEYSLKACGEKEAIVLPSLSQSQRLSGESGISLLRLSVLEVYLYSLIEVTDVVLVFPRKER